MSDEMRLKHLSPAPGSQEDAKRVGRGIGAGTVKLPVAATRARNLVPAARSARFRGRSDASAEALPKVRLYFSHGRTTRTGASAELNAVEAMYVTWTR